MTTSSLNYKVKNFIKNIRKLAFSKTYVVVISLARLKFLKVMVVCIVQSNCITVIKKFMAGAVITVRIVLVKMRVGIAVQNSYTHFVDPGKDFEFK